MCATSSDSAGIMEALANAADEAARRLQAALDMFDDGVALVRARLVREHPTVSPEEIDALVQRWLMTRPGAEHDDGVGRPRPVRDPAG